MWFCKKSEKVSVLAPIDGKTISLDQVNDEVFRKRMMGSGLAIIPKSDIVVAPVDGKITLVMDSCHAYGITANNGMEILIHIGIDTVKLKGEGFWPQVEMEQTVKRGQPLVKFNRKMMLEKQYDVDVILVFPNGEEHGLSGIQENLEVIAGKTEIAAFNK